jgi:hypothetical protein
MHATDLHKVVPEVSAAQIRYEESIKQLELVRKWIGDLRRKHFFWNRTQGYLITSKDFDEVQRIRAEMDHLLGQEQALLAELQVFMRELAVSRGKFKGGNI